MLARTASYLYWIGRYMERAEFTARLIEATLRLDALSARPAGEGAWSSALSVAAAKHDFEQTGESPTPSNVANFLTFSKDNPNSIRNCLYTARMNARAVRTALTREGWESINRAWLGIDGRSAVGSAQGTINLLEALIAENRGFEGALHRMLRQESYHFLMLGESIERTDNTARLIDVKYHIILPEGEEVGGLVDRDQWGTILQTVSANTAFRWLYRDGLSSRRVVEMLILRRELPRSIAATVDETAALLTELGRLTGYQGEADRMARLRQQRINATGIREIITGGLHEYLQAFIEENRLLSQAISRQFRFD
ncbi:alpha-E domain-containing protein [Parasphingopyxis algicola]|uniref:alpha-E domain-containing protein n=1 Tax=Parasphingopyxis algicola TaxID=2026624 RepID=UPI0015A42DE2|nr:alpha-E domain-containing protein [Parasphingopyxis algicola]QLC26187.1 alpha-E domain-containing protein [Parasphingopyxis algicola]